MKLDSSFVKSSVFQRKGSQAAIRQTLQTWAMPDVNSMMSNDRNIFTKISMSMSSHFLTTDWPSSISPARNNKKDSLHSRTYKKGWTINIRIQSKDIITHYWTLWSIRNKDTITTNCLPVQVISYFSLLSQMLCREYLVMEIWQPDQETIKQSW